MKALIDTNIEVMIDNVACNPVVGLVEERHSAHPSIQFVDFVEGEQEWTYWYRSINDGSFIHYCPPVPNEEEPQENNEEDSQENLV